MENQPKTGVTLPPGFWSQPSSDQLERIEALLQRFLSLPGMDNEAKAQPTPLVPTGGEKPVPQNQNSAPSPNRDWSPSGSTWGPLAEAWKSVQGKAGMAENTLSEKGNGENQATQRPKAVPFTSPPPKTVTEQTVIPWNFRPDIPSEPASGNPKEVGSFGFPAEKLPSNQTPAFSPDRTNLGEPSPIENVPPLGSQPEKPGWVYSALVLTNRLIDSCLNQVGTPGRIMRSGLGKWVLGLAGIALLGSGSWLYMREAIEEIWGQLRFGGPGAP